MCETHILIAIHHSWFNLLHRHPIIVGTSRFPLYRVLRFQSSFHLETLNSHRVWGIQSTEVCFVPENLELCCYTFPHIPVLLTSSFVELGPQHIRCILFLKCGVVVQPRMLWSEVAKKRDYHTLIAPLDGSMEEGVSTMQVLTGAAAVGPSCHVGLASSYADQGLFGLD